MQRFLLFAAGSRGDIQPYLALGAGLVAAGHQVTLIASADVSALAARLGLQAVTPDLSAGFAAQRSAMQLVEKGRLLQMLRATGAGALQLALTLAHAALPYAADADHLVAGLGGLFTAHALAGHFARRFTPALLMPLSTTASRPSLLLPQQRLPAVIHRLSHRLTQQLLWVTLFRSSDQAVRRDLFGAPPLSAAARRTVFDGTAPLLYGFSPAVVPPAPDWPATVTVTGAWHLPLHAETPLAPELERFLAAGSPPVVVGFGSMHHHDPAAVADLVIRTLRHHGRRGILLSGWDGLRADALPADMLLLDQAAHQLLLPHAAAVVHHGGAGTTMAGLTAGIPNLVVPFFGDQPFWGRRVADLGVGPLPLPRRRLTAERFSLAVDQLLSDHALRERAAQLGRRMRAEDGLLRAAAALG